MCFLDYTFSENFETLFFWIQWWTKISADTNSEMENNFSLQKYLTGRTENISINKFVHAKIFIKKVFVR